MSPLTEETAISRGVLSDTVKDRLLAAILDAQRRIDERHVVHARHPEVTVVGLERGARLGFPRLRRTYRRRCQGGLTDALAHFG